MQRQITIASGCVNVRVALEQLSNNVSMIAFDGNVQHNCIHHTFSVKIRARLK